MRQDMILLRVLAKRVADVASLSIQAERKRLWACHNRLKPQRPMVLCQLEGGWIEAVREVDLQCATPLHRKFERQLLQILWQHENVRDDTVVEPWFDISSSDYIDPGNWGLCTEFIRPRGRGARAWKPPLRNLADAKNLRIPKPRADLDLKKSLVERASGLFGDILPVRTRGNPWWTQGLTQDLVYLRGFEPLMLDILDRPAWLHGFMGFLRDGQLARLEALEKMGELHLNCSGDPVGSGGLGSIDDLPSAGYAGVPRLKDLWALAEAQEFIHVSPEVFEEFIWPYQKPVLERFGLSCYGCCEPLNGRYRFIKTLKNLRRVSVSPWADQDEAARELGRNYIFSRKPNPTLLAGDQSPTEAEIKADLTGTYGAAGNCVLEFVMKDTHTFQGDPSRISLWSQVASEMAGAA